MSQIADSEIAKCLEGCSWWHDTSIKIPDFDTLFNTAVSVLAGLGSQNAGPCISAANQPPIILPINHHTNDDPSLLLPRLVGKEPSWFIN